MGWFLTVSGFEPDLRLARDWMRYPELRWLDRFDILVPVAFAFTMFALGSVLGHTAPQLKTSGAQMLVWGFCISTVLCWHATYSINSLSHLFGRQRYRTDDTRRNNHHYYPNAARQGFYGWECDLTYYLLKLLSWLGLIWELQTVPLRVRYNPQYTLR